MRTRERDMQFSAFYETEAEQLHRLGMVLARDRELGSDLAQEALLRTYRAWNRIEGNAAAYARRVLLNLYRNAYRRRLLEWRHRLKAGQEATSNPSANVDEAMRVADALKVLTPIRRATILLRFYEDLPEAEIASILDRPVGTVKSDIHRSLQKLRPVLVDQEERERA